MQLPNRYVLMKRIITILCLLFSIQSMAQIGIVDSTTWTQNPATLVNTTDNFSSIGASVAIAGIWDFAVAAAGTVTDNQGNTYTLLGTYAGSTYRISIYGAKMVNTSATHTISYTTGVLAYSSISVLTLSGVDTSITYLDRVNGSASGVDYLKQPGSITPSANNEIVINAINSAGNTGTGPPTISSPYVISGATRWVSGAFFSGAMAWNIQTTATATNPTWTCPTSNSHAAMQVSLFPVSATVTDGDFLSWW